MRARTFTESGRRAQIVTAAIEVIADVGFAKASFSRIAKHAGLSSTGMISYHFAGKDDLLAACVAEIESNVALVGEHPAAVRALIDIVRNTASASAAVNGRLALFEEHFRTGQAAGVFRPFD